MLTKLEQRERVVAIAKKRFLNYGFNQVSIGSIVKELRTSKSTVYKYFNSKEDLIKCVIDQMEKEITKNIEQIILDQAKSFCSKLGAIIELNKDILSSINDEFLKDLQFYYPEIWEYYEQLRLSRINKYYRQLLTNGIDEGIIRRDINIEILLTVYMQLTKIPFNNGHFQKVHTNNQELYDDISRVFLEGAMIRK